MADTTYQPKVYRTDGGDKFVVASGGTIDIESGGYFKIAGTAVTASAAELNALTGGGNSTTSTTYTIDSDSATGTFILKNVPGAAGVFSTTLQTSDPSADRTITLPDASGTVALTSDTWTDVDLGSSAVAGSLDIFPLVAANGKLTLTYTSPGGAYNLGITNDTLAASRSYKIPDAGGDGKFVMTTAAKSLLVNCNGTDRTMSLAGNVSFAGAVTLAGALTTGAGIIFSGADAIQFNTNGANTYTLPATAGTLALTTGSETGTASSVFTVDNDSSNAKIALDTNAATGNFTLSLVPATLTANRTVTFGDATGQVVLRDSTDILSSKTLTAPVINGATTAAAANNFVLNTGSGTFTTPSGVFTHYGNVASNGAITFDFSGSSGTFKTSTGAHTLGGDVTIAAGKQLDIGTTSGGDATPLRIFSATAANGLLVVKCQNDANDNTTTLQSGDPGAAANPTITLPIATSTLATTGLAETLDTKTLTNAGAIAQTGAVAFTTGSGAIAINGATTWAASLALTTAGAGTGSVDFSLQTGTFKTTTGAVTLAGDTSTAVGKTLTVLGATSGGIKLAPTAIGTNNTTLVNQLAGAEAVITLPSATCTLGGLGLANTWSAINTFSVQPLITIDDAATNSVTDLLRLTHSSSGVVAGGFGTGASFYLEDLGGIEEQASMDVVLDTVTDGAEDASIIFKEQLNGDVSQVLKLDGANQAVVVGQNVSDADGIASLWIFPVTADKGKLVLTATANSADHVTTITNAAQGGAYTYTIPNAGGSKYFAMTASATGATLRADMTEEALAVYRIGLMDCKDATGLHLPAAPAAGIFGMTNGGYGVGTLKLVSEGANNTTKTSTLCFEFALPPEYVAAGDVKVQVKANYTGAGTVGTKTLDCEAYELADEGTVGADICATGIATLIKDTFTDHAFTITATDLVAGDKIIVFLQAIIQESVSGGALTVNVGNIEVQCDIKG